MPQILHPPFFPRCLQLCVTCCCWNVISDEGKVLSWGHGGHGQLGHCSIHSCKEPTVVETLAEEHVTFIACGGSTSAAVTGKAESKRQECLSWFSYSYTSYIVLNSTSKDLSKSQKYVMACWIEHDMNTNYLELWKSLKGAYSLYLVMECSLQLHTVEMVHFWISEKKILVLQSET